MNEAQLIRKLNDEGYRTSTGSKFTHNVLSRILQNRIYIGTFCYRGKDYPNFAPKILTDEYFARAQIRKKQKHVVRSQSADFFLVGKIFCGICGKHIVGTSGTSKTGKRYAYYMCSSRNHILRQKKACRCSLMTIRKEWLEDKILGVTTRLLNNPDTRAEIARRCAYEQVNQEEDLRVQRLKKELATIKKKLNNCVKAIEEGFITATVSEKISLYEEEVARLEEQIKKSELLARPVVVTEKFIEYYLQKFYKQKKYDRQQFDLFQTFIHRITVYADYIEIQYKVSNSLKLPDKPVIMRGSGKFSLVDHQGIEPWTP
ncbi:recombinase family protein [Megasphaera massiliensis]|uniref:recombinase family protein n=1 Tax=Megasphaera massiliensis TaxID=1232428 RepID=UPI003AB4520A